MLNKILKIYWVRSSSLTPKFFVFIFCSALRYTNYTACCLILNQSLQASLVFRAWQLSIILNLLYKTRLSLRCIYGGRGKTLAVKCKIVFAGIFYRGPLKKGCGKHRLVLVGDPYNYTATSLVDLFGIKE